MILQAESKREYEEVSLKMYIRPFSVLSPFFIYIFISELSSRKKYLSKNDGGELSSLICVVFMFWFVLEHVCHSWYQSFRRLVLELKGKPLSGYLLFFFSLSQWICTVNNISRQIYLTDNPEVTHPRTTYLRMMILVVRTSHFEVSHSCCFFFHFSISGL